MSFSQWAEWSNRTTLPGLDSPGVYALAISSVNISMNPFSCIPEIVYIGQTNAQKGLKSRLSQFDKAIQGKKGGHGGGERAYFKHNKYKTLVPKLYVAVNSFPCDVSSQSPSDLRIMGEVLKHEFDCFAKFVEHFGHLPEFNDQKRSPKK